MTRGFASGGCVWRCYHYCVLKRSAAAADELEKLNGGGGRYFTFCQATYWVCFCVALKPRWSFGCIAAVVIMELQMLDLSVFLMVFKGTNRKHWHGWWRGGAEKKNTNKKLKREVIFATPQRHLKAVFHKINLLHMRGSWHVTTSEEICVKN